MREIAPFGLRMPPELKDRLGDIAKANGRSLNTEIVARLWASLETKTDTAKPTPVLMSPTSAAYVANIELDEIERELLMIFRRLPIEKRLALVSLFK